MMNRIRHLLEVKGYDTWLIRPDAMVIDALRLMVERDVAALLVMEHGRLTGIVTEQDYARKVEILGRSAQTTRVSEIMTNAPITLHPDQTVQEAMEWMANKHIGHLPVMEGEDVIGLISAGDLLRDMVYQQKRAIQGLESRLAVESPRGRERKETSNAPYEPGMPLGE
jgi:CBS domain-containing protein